MSIPKDPKKALAYRKLLSEKLKGRKFTEEHRKKLSAAKINSNPIRSYKGDKNLSWYYRNHEMAKARRRKYRKSQCEELLGRPKPKKCEICGDGGRICFDHCHKTDEPRGWICEHCNVLLGFAKDDIIRLKKLIKYLEKFSTLRD